MAPIHYLFGAAFAGLAVAAGALGAHALKAILSPERLMVFETAVRYQMYHALALLIVSGMARGSAPRAMRVAGWCFVAGIVLFSGSLYVVAFTNIRGFGAITPIGGAAFIAGWIALVWTAWQTKA